MYAPSRRPASEGIGSARSAQGSLSQEAARIQANFGAEERLELGRERGLVQPQLRDPRGPSVRSKIESLIQ